MKLVVGLGNPGRRYEQTRHNLGFRVVDTVAARWGIELGREKFQAVIGDGNVADQRMILLKPMTFMNLSGRAVQAAVGFYKVAMEDLLVVSDDLDLPVGRLRMRASGSAGGHRGLDDIIRLLGTTQFARLRIGIGRSERRDEVSHVLGGIEGDEAVALDETVKQAADAVECWCRKGVTAAMNEFNRVGGESDDAGPGTSDKGAGP